MKIVNPATGGVHRQRRRGRRRPHSRGKDRAPRAPPSPRCGPPCPFGERLAAIGRGSASRSSPATTRLAKTLTLEVGKPIRQSRNELNGLIDADRFLPGRGPSARSPARPSSTTPAQHLREERIAARAARHHRQHLGVELPVLRRQQRLRAGARRRQRGPLQAFGVRNPHRPRGSPRCCTGRASLARSSAPVIGGGEAGATLLESSPSTACSSPARTRRGRRSPAAAGKRMVKIQLDLGGKDPTYVCDDVDTEERRDRASPTGRSTTPASSCCSVERIYVHAAGLRRVRRRLRRRGQRGYRVGDPMDEATYIGPLTRRPQLEVLAAAGGRREAQRRPGARRRQAASGSPATGSSRRCWSTSTTRCR